MVSEESEPDYRKGGGLELIIIIKKKKEIPELAPHGCPVFAGQ